MTTLFILHFEHETDSMKEYVVITEEKDKSQYEEYCNPNFKLTSVTECETLDSHCLPLEYQLHRKM